MEIRCLKTKTIISALYHNRELPIPYRLPMLSRSPALNLCAKWLSLMFSYAILAV